MTERRPVLVVVVLALVSAAGCPPPDDEPAAWDFGLPVGWPDPIVPADNPMSTKKVALGRALFFDTRLSGNQTYSCGSCHDPAKAFTDGLAQAKGSTDEIHPRGSMTVLNAAYATTYGWANQTLRTFEAQALVPMFGDRPVELGLEGLEDDLLARFTADADAVDAFAGAFEGDAAADDDESAVTLDHITHALAAYQRALLPHRTRFDDYQYRGQPDALTEQEKRGYALFLGERFECYHCHGGFNFSDATTFVGNPFDATPFHNNGLYNLDDVGGYPRGNQGLFEQTGEDRDRGRFKAPTLRNIALTAPYMHDGSLATLEEVLEHYARGGRLIEDGETAGDGALNPNKDGFVRGFDATAEEKADVIAFLRALTDEALIADEVAAVAELGSERRRETP